MCEHFNAKINLLKQQVLTLASEVIEVLENTALALQTTDIKRAAAVIQNDAAIDLKEVEIEEECIRLIAHYQPVAADLRLLITLLKVNGELERIADLATDIAERIFLIAGNEPPEAHKIDFSPILNEAQKMLRDAVKSLVNRNPTLARIVILEDDTVDRLDREINALVERIFEKDYRFATYAHHVATISHAIERIADCTTNICEDVIYLDNGAIVRHTLRKQLAIAPTPPAED